MNILETHTHYLTFKIESTYNAPKNIINKFNKIKQDCENTNNKCIIDEIKNYYKLESNKCLPYLDRSEGGLGGNNNQTNKQIRFRIPSTGEITNNILLYVYNSDLEKWTYSELDDIIYAFIKVLNNKLNVECIDGYIEMRNKNTFYDDYLDSD